MSSIDLSRLPAPKIIQTVSYADELAALIADFKARSPAHARAVDLESEPVRKLLETVAYRNTLKEQEFNDRAAGNLLATSSGLDLDHLAANYGITRLVVQEADDTINPPAPEVLESDPALRQRVWLSLDRAAGGTPGFYRYHALTADGAVKDVSVVRPRAGDVTITILSHEGDGTPAAETLAAVQAALDTEDTRQLCTVPVVQAPTIIPFTVEADLTLYEGPDQELVIATARERLTATLARLHALGLDITISALTAALHVEGVHEVTLTSPAASIDVGPEQVAWSSADPMITVVGRDA